MKDLTAAALRYKHGELHVLDQRKLPGEVCWHVCKHENDLVALIQGLAIRGAPLLGIAAAVWVGHCAMRGDSNEQLTHTIALLRASRPTAVNLMNYLDRLQKLVDSGADRFLLSDEVEAIFDEDVALCDSRRRYSARCHHHGT